MKKYLLLLSLLTVFNFNCNTTEPPPPQKEQPKDVKLKLLDVSCTEAFINITASDTVLPINLTLNKDDKALFNFTLTKADTTIIDTTLQAGKTYVYQTAAIINGEEQKSDTLQVNTLPITSDSYSWQKFYFGNGASSTFYDVAIIDENNIWCVGIININDSSANGFTTYNAVHWDGSDWKLKKIDFYTICGQTNKTTYPTKSIYIINDSTFWVAMDGDQLAKLENGIQIKIVCLPWSFIINKIWGTSSNDFYVVGNDGNIAHYQSGQWSKIESGTNLNIHDINGFVNPLTGKTEILCVADDPNYQQDVQVIRIKQDNTTELLDNNGLGIAISSVWFAPGLRYYIVGNGLYEKTYKDTAQWIDLNENRKITQNYMVSIKGTGLNDIIVTGAFGEVIHFNGLHWNSLINQTSLDNGTYSSVALKGNMVVAVGQDQNQGVILFGRRQ